MPKLDLAAIPERTGTIYPAPYDRMVEGRSSQRLGDAGGLTQFGVKLFTLQPGAMSSLRHWHEAEDEFVLVTDGELTLVEDDGETAMRRGDCAAFPAGAANGHHFVNRSATPGSFLVVGTRAPSDVCHYSDVDLVLTRATGGSTFTRRDGAPVEGG
jgi:uncharacterized cupin superfamily protein